MNLVFFSHVRVDVKMCLMCKDYRFIPFYCIYAIAVRAGFEIFFISFSYLILFTGLLHHKDLSACFFLIKQGPMVEQSRLNGTPCINIFEIKNKNKLEGFVDKQSSMWTTVLVITLYSSV